MTNTRPDVLNRAVGTSNEFRRLMSDYRMHPIARNLARGTVVMRVLTIEQLQTTHPDVLAVTGTDLERYIASRMRTHKPETLRARRSSFLTFYGWAHSTGLIAENPALALRPIRLPRTVARVANDDRLRATLLTASLPDTAMILLGRSAGLRLSEITTLRTADREGDVLRIQGKGGHTRMVPIDHDLSEVLTRLEHLQGPGYYFPGRFGGHIHPHTVSKRIREVAGINAHALRHRAATAIYEATHDVRGLQEVLGHVSLATTERYIHVEQEHLIDLVQAGALER